MLDFTSIEESFDVSTVHELGFVREKELWIIWSYSSYGLDLMRTTLHFIPTGLHRIFVPSKDSCTLENLIKSSDSQFHMADL